MPVTSFVLPLEDVSSRDPEWQEIEPGYGQGPFLRTFEYDPIHDEIRVTGPVIVGRKHINPVP